MPTHALKTVNPFFKDVVEGKKTFEVRKADRNFSPGDRLLLQEWDNENGQYTGEEWTGRITYIMREETGFTKKGYVIFGITELDIYND